VSMLMVNLSVDDRNGAPTSSNALDPKKLWSHKPIMRTLKSATVPLLALCLAPFSASALLMRDNGPEPVIVQVKESIRLSMDLYAQLQNLAALEASLGVSVEKRWVGSKYLELVTFPSDFTEEDALSVITRLEQSPSVEQVVAVSAFNLVFGSIDFAHEYAPDDVIPEAILRGVDSGPTIPVDPSSLQQPHVPNQFIVAWKPEYIWNAAQTGFLQTIADFNASEDCRVISESSASLNELVQVLEFDDSTASLLDKLEQYATSGWVEYAQPNYLYYASDIPRHQRKKRSQFNRTHEMKRSSAGLAAPIRSGLFHYPPAAQPHREIAE